MSAESSSLDRAAQSSRLFAYIHRYRNLLRKHWWVPALTILLALAAQGWRLWHTPAMFRSGATMVTGFKFQTGMTGPGSGAMEDTMRFYDTQASLMQGSVVLERASIYVATTYPNVTQLGEPSTAPVSVNSESDCSSLARPKSATRGSSSASRRMFEGLRSR